MEALLFNVQRFSLHDGPGIRTTVFFKGCNLRCQWCHNPESFEAQPSLQFFEQKCVGCGKCFQTCALHTIAEGQHRIDRENCVRCGKCAAGCFAEALVLTGKRREMQDLLREVLRDKDFYEESGGGVTCSGGEPMLQIDFLEAFLKACKQNGLHTAVDTAGNIAWESYQRVLPYTDLFLYDLKAMDSAEHKRFTGVPNERILENLRLLSASGAAIEIRMPVLPGWNGTVQNMRAMAAFLRPLRGISRVELLPFHRLAQSKYASLSLPYPVASLDPPTPTQMQSLAKLLEGLPVHIS